MFIINVTGGLGNQMFQYALGRSLSIAYETDFFLDVSFFGKQELRNFELDCFQAEIQFPERKSLDQLKGKKDFYLKVFNKFGISLNKLGGYFKEKQNPFFEDELFDITRSLYLDGSWQNEMYFKSIRDLIISDFTLKKELVPQKLSKFIHNLESRNSVSLHVRRGDYINNPIANAVHGTCSIDYYYKAIDYISGCISEPKYLVFSDDIDWCKRMLFDALPEDTIFVDFNEHAYLDLYLMSCCNHNIIANSSFSWWGAWLNNSTEKVVVAPHKWTVNSNSVNWTPSDWIKIKG